MTTAVQIQYRRGTAAQVGSFTGAAGEMVVDTTNNRLVVQDGATAGGFAAAKLSEVVTTTRTPVSDANYTALATDRTIAYTSLTAARIVALPAASSFPTGLRLLVVDESGACSGSKTITLSANGSDLIGAAASAAINTAYGYLALECNGVNKWVIVDQPGGGGSSGVTTFNSLSGSVTTAVVTQVFTASGTYTPSAGMLHCIIECLGGGGGGGGAAGAGSGNQSVAAGGGAGAYSRKYATAAAIGASQTVTVGAAGGGGSAGNNPGGNGGQSSVGTLCTANGGTGGGGAASGAGANGGAGATAGTGDVTGTGQAGFSGFGGSSFTAIGFPPGNGGSTFLGGGGLGPQITGAGAFTGNTGTGYGAGGSGGASYSSSSTAAGGAGAKGIVIITEFVNV